MIIKLVQQKASFNVFFSVNRVPVGLEDVSTYPALFAELIRRGWTDDDLVKLAGKNLVRVFTRVEQVIVIGLNVVTFRKM